MTAPQTSAGIGGGGSPSIPAGHHPTDVHLLLAADAVTRGGTEADTVHRVAQAIADAEDRIRYGSAYCPDCGTHCDIPHQAECPTGLHTHEETR